MDSAPNNDALATDLHVERDQDRAAYDHRSWPRGKLRFHLCGHGQQPTQLYL